MTAKRMPEILLTNDDGFNAPGIEALAEALADIATVTLIAPATEQSAKSHAITLGRPLRLKEKGPRRFTLDGTPSDCVYMGIHKVLGDRLPDLVVSGINRGPNVGSDVIYSGTVAAAVEGALTGIPSIAFSLTEGNDFSGAAILAGRIVQRALAQGLRVKKSEEFQGVTAQPISENSDISSEVNKASGGIGRSQKGNIKKGHTAFDSAVDRCKPFDEIENIRKNYGFVWNVNFPLKITGEVTVTKLGRRTYGGQVVERLDPRGTPYLWVGGAEAIYDPAPGTDCRAIYVQGITSITPLSVDLTAIESLSDLQTSLTGNLLADDASSMTPSIHATKTTNSEGDADSNFENLPSQGAKFP